MGQLKQKQTGVVLFIALIALVVLTLAGIAMVHSTTTANLIAENRAYDLATVQVSDTGVESAIVLLTSTILAHPDTAIANTYFPLSQALQPDGTPVANWSAIPTATIQGYGVQYVIERMCTGTPLPIPVTSLSTYCMTLNNTAASSNGSKLAGQVVLTSAPTFVYYRISVRATGPKNTTSIIRAMVVY